MTLTHKNEWLQQITTKRFQRLGREFFWIGSGQAVATLGALVGVRLLTVVLSPDVYGELALGMTLATLVNKVMLGPLGNAALRFLAPAREKNEFTLFLRALYKLLIWATGLVFLVAGVVFLVLFLTRQFNWLWLSIAAFAFALLSGYNSVLNGMQNAARQRAIVAWHQALASWGRFLAAIGMVLWLGVNSTVAMLGYVLATPIALLSQFWFFRRTFRFTGGELTAKTDLSQYWETQMSAYAWPFALWGVFTWAQVVSDRWALQMFASTREVGLYVVLYQLGYYPITILSGLMMQLVAPMFFQRAGDATDSSRMRRVYILNWQLTISVLLLTIVAAVLAAALHGLIFELLVAPDYRSISWLLPAVVLAGGLFATGQFASIDLMNNVETQRLIVPKITTAAIGVILNLLGAAWFGVAGVVAAGVVFSVSHFVWVVVLVRQRDRKVL